MSILVIIISYLKFKFSFSPKTCKTKILKIQNFSFQLCFILPFSSFKISFNQSVLIKQIYTFTGYNWSQRIHYRILTWNFQKIVYHLPLIYIHIKYLTLITHDNTIHFILRTQFTLSLPPCKPFFTYTIITYTQWVFPLGITYCI